MDYFSRKGIAAQHGALVPPEDNTNWAIPLEQPYGFRTQMAQSRARLVNDLDNGGRDRFPGLAARAQVAYDCWLERTEMDWQREFDGQCHKDFIATINALEAALKGQPAAQAHQYNVYFEFDRSNLTPKAARWSTPSRRRRRVSPTSTSASSARPTSPVRSVQHVAVASPCRHRRARLRADGVDEKLIDETWDGFRNPPVPTAKGVREPRNRVVEVQLQ